MFIWTSLGLSFPKLLVYTTHARFVYTLLMKQICIIIAATRSKTSSESKRGSLEEDDVQLPLKLVIKPFLRVRQNAT